ncbi:MAG: hypothetical protein ACRD8Z_08850, partial [Nitrososphaeraceae archaeon]
SEAAPTPLTKSTVNPISAKEIEWVPLLPEYPKTHRDGCAYIVNLQHMNEAEKKGALENVSNN